MSLEDAARRLADEQRSKNAAAATAAEARQARMATPTPEGLEFVSFCRKHGVAAVPIRNGVRQKRWSGKSVDIFGGRGWPLDVYDGGSQSAPRLCICEDGTVVLVRGYGPYSKGDPVDPTDLPWWASASGSLADILAKSASNILIKKENGKLYPPF